MQQPQLTFPSVKAVSQEAFFGQGLNPPPTPDVLAVTDKYKQVFEPDETPPGDDPAQPKITTPVSDKSTEEVSSITDKYKADAPPVEAVEKPAFVNADEPKPEIVTPEQGSAPSEGVAGSDDSISQIPFHEVANMLQEKGLIVDIPEGFPITDVNKDNIWELIDHNITKRVVEEFDSGYEAARTDLVKSVTSETLDILNFQLTNPNASPEEVKYHIQSVVYAREIGDLDPTDPMEAEVIIRQYLEVGNTQEEIDFQVAEAKELGKLEQRATMYKPKVEQRAQEQVAQSRQRQQQIVQLDAQRHEAFMAKVDNILKNNKILGVEIGQAERADIRGILANNRVPVPINGGQTVELGLFDYLARKNMYAADGNVENVMLASLVLKHGAKALEKYIAAPVQKEAARKFASQQASGSFSAAPAAARNPTPVSLEDKRKRFFSSIGNG